MMRISLTSWWKRLWTLQEGVFAERILFQFSDAAVDAERLLMEMGGLPSDVFDLRTVIFTEISRPIYSLRMFNVYYRSGKRVDYIMKALQWRCTSRAEDEPICLATLLDLDLKDIINESGGRRMQKFVELQRVFPRDVLFCRSQRLQEIGFRWAPVTWTSIYDEANVDKETYTLAQCDGEGLYVEAHGFLLDIVMDHEDAGLKDEMKICVVEMQTSLVCGLSFYIGGAEQALTLEKVNFKNINNPAIILQHDIRFDHNRSETRAILVSIRREERQIYYVTYIMDALLFPIYSDSRLRGSIKRTSWTQQWCIG